jgi:hypothetical protein
MHQRPLFHRAAAAIAMTSVSRRVAISPDRTDLNRLTIDDDWLAGGWVSMPEAQFGDVDAG